MSQTKQILIYLLIALLLLQVLCKRKKKPVKRFHWKHMNVDIEILDNGDARITEHHSIYFIDYFTFGFRTIPLNAYGNNDGIEGVSVSQGDTVYKQIPTKEPFTFEVIQSDSEMKLYWYFPQTTGEHQVQVSYTVKRPVRIDSKQCEFFWKAIPPDHAEIIQKSKVSVKLPIGINPNYVDVYVARNDYEFKNRGGKIIRDGDTTIFDLPSPLHAYEVLEVRMQFYSPIMSRMNYPNWQATEHKGHFISLFLFVIAVCLPFIPAYLYFFVYVDPRVNPNVETQNPETIPVIPPGLAGVLFKNGASIEHVLATLVNLAKKRYLQIIDNGIGWFFKQSENPPPLTSLEPHEAQVYHQLFKYGPYISLESLQYKFVNDLGTINDAFYQDLLAGQFTHQSIGSLKKKLILGGILLGFSGFISLCVFGTDSIIFGYPLISLHYLSGAAIICGAQLLFMGGLGLFSVRTPKGVMYYKHLHSFKKYLERIIAGRVLLNDRSLYEAYLPYSIAFGLTKYYRNYWTVYETQTYYIGPSWYHRTYDHTSSSNIQHTRGLSFSERLNLMLNSTSKVMTTKPSSSSGSSRSSGSRSSSSGGGGSVGFG